ncbi:hypothetical protein [Chamaesiphon sp. VAR_48_metabat_135_sub]|uniref:hypothetical protein n=1 Tax=Chamaesiphon sp. VAR_48_metabat_135_sub TaxID=2964699 RepID=UPI00286C8F15|nr:hypothetical protein [Chamaesiphon sp. VAR_48_metabat_135_sub]
METNTINCSEVCKDGCIQPDRCQNQTHIQSASKFINETSLDKMHEIAEEARRKKMTAPPVWVIPDWQD